MTQRLDFSAALVGLILAVVCAVPLVGHRCSGCETPLNEVLCVGLALLKFGLVVGVFVLAGGLVLAGVDLLNHHRERAY
jgi:hypothetical protein